MEEQVKEEVVTSTNEDLETALNTEIAGNNKEVIEKTPEQIEAEKVEIEKVKEPVKEVIEDPEYDLGLDEDKKTPIKFKRSQILEMKKGSMLQADYTKKTQELATEKANLKEVVDIIEYLKKNPSKAEKIVAILEAKEEAIKEAVVDLNKETTDIDKLLSELPEDDPYAKALRSQKAILQETLKTNQKIQARLDQLDTSRGAEEQSKLEAECQQTLTEVLTTKQKALTFSDQEEADYWKKLALTYLVNNPKEYEQMDKTQFAEYFNGIGDKVHAEIKKIGEKHVNAYIKSKGGKGVIPVVGGGSVPASVENDSISIDNLQASLERELKKVKDN